MAYNKTTILTTREEVRGGRLAGQVISVPTGRLDKVSVYVEPSFSNAASSTVVLSVYSVDSNIPIGPPIASASLPASDFSTRKFYNFSLPTPTPQKVAIVLSVVGGDADNFLGWRYVQASAIGEPLLVSEDYGATWVADTSRKFAYIAYSQIPDAVTFENPSSSLAQTAKIQAGTPDSVVDDALSGFDGVELTRAEVDGSNVVIGFGDFVISMVVDMSGSMTWNDRQGTRFQFLNDYIDDLESILPSSSQALYSITKFNSRKVGRMRLLLQAEGESAIAGARVVRKIGAMPVTGPTDGVVIFEGLAEELLDANLTPGSLYQYGIFVFDEAGNFSVARTSFSSPADSINVPLGVAGFKAEEEVVLNGDYDIGKRRIKLSWSHPQLDDANLAYSKIYLVRRDDRPPLHPQDGTVIFSGITSVDAEWEGPYYDFNTPFIPLVGSPKDHSDYPAAGLTYYYAMFTENDDDIRCLSPNAGRGSVLVSEADRFWERAEPPFDDPLTYGFDETPPAPPTSITTVVGDGELQFSWLPGGASTRRYAVYYKPDEYPQAVDVDGLVVYNGEVVHDGSASSFIHSGLDNGQPHFYVLVALDSVGNRSAGEQFTAKPVEGQTDIIAPDAADSFEAEPYNATTNKLSWRLPLSDDLSVDGWFGDSVQAICNVTFADSDPRTTSATLEFVEESRSSTTIMPDNSLLVLDEEPSSRIAPGTTSIEVGEGDGLQTIDTTLAIVPTVAMQFGSSPHNNTTTISSTFSASPLLAIQSRMEEVNINFHGLLSVKEASTGALITGVKTQSASIKLRNPFAISISNEPESFVNRPTWDPSCTPDSSPKGGYDRIPGVYAGTGAGFPLVVEASFRDLPLEENINLTFRIIDKETGEPSSVVVLPNTSTEGEAVLSTSQEEDEILDRSGQPTGDTRPVTRVFVELPPQDAPGDYIVEVTGTYLGYVRTSTMEVHYEPALNIDLDLKPFAADGIDVAEQSAFVYLGDPLGDDKSPVGDLTITDWKIAPLDPVSAKNIRKRPFYSRDNVPGTGVRSYVRGGSAKNVFFGPAVDIGPDTSEEQTAQEGTSCVTGDEIYEISVTANFGGFTRTSFGAIRLTPSPEAGPELNRIFLRKVDAFNKDSIFADGIQESTWEVIALPENDGTVSDRTSGAFFRDATTTLGGLVPQLAEGAVVTLTTRLFHGATSDRLYVRTNLTGPEGRPWYAKAVVEDGRALFHLRLNTRVSGNVLQSPLAGENGAGSNIIYGDANTVGWNPSALIFSLSAYVPIEIGGRPVTFYGGGSNLERHTPPCFLSFDEPLGFGLGDT